MAIAQVVRLMVSTTYQGVVVCNNTFHFANDSAATGPGLNASDLALDFDHLLITTAGGGLGVWRNHITPSLAFNSIYYDVLYPNAVGSGILGLGGVLGGNAPGGFTVPVPVVCAVLTTWRTALGGRSGRGRTYWAGVLYTNIATAPNGVSPPTDIAAGAGQGGRAHAVAISDAIRTRYDSVAPLFNGWYHVVRSTKVTGTVVPINPAGCHPVTGYSIPNYWCSMGSRRGGHGM